MPQELTPPPQATNISSPTGATDPSWFAWFQEIWDKSRQGFQAIISEEVSSQENYEFILTDKFKGFTDYKIAFNNILVSQPDTSLSMVISLDSGSSYETATDDYSWVYSITSVISSKSYNTLDSSMELIEDNLGNTSTNVVTGEIIFYDLAGSGSIKWFKWDMRYKDVDDNLVLLRGAGSYNSSGEINGIKITPSQGLISSGSMEIFGAK